MIGTWVRYCMEEDWTRVPSQGYSAGEGGKDQGRHHGDQGIIEEFKMQTLGGMMAPWELWERALILSLLSVPGLA